MEELYAAVAAALRAGEPVALVTLVRVDGSAPRAVGTQMLVWGDGRAVGTIGGGLLEASITGDAQAALASGDSGLKEYSLRGEEAAGLGVCGGQVQAFIHVLQPPERLVIVGAGHVARPLAELATRAGFRVVVADDRPDMLQSEHLAAAETVAIDMARLRSQVRLDAQTSVVIVTRSHQHDEAVLRQLLDQPLAYLGMMGSRTKVRRTFDRLREEGFSDEQLRRVHAPIGLDIGAETPAELAVSIVAELIMARHGRTGLPMSRVPAG